MPYGLANRQRAIAAFSAQGCRAAAGLRRGAGARRGVPARAGAEDAAQRRRRHPRADRRRGARPAAARPHARRQAAAARSLHQERRRFPRQLVRERGGEGRASPSTASSAPMPARTRRARPTCCCTTASARSTASAASGATPSAAWAPSRRPWRDAAAGARRRHPPPAPRSPALIDARTARPRACGSHRGERIAARAVAANIAAEAAVPRSRAGGRRRAGAATPLHRPQVGLGHLPHERRAVRAAGFPLPARQGSRRTITAPASSSARRIDYLERAYLDARTHGWSREPVVEMLIPSTLDADAGAAGQARGQPVRAARGPAPARRPQLGRRQRTSSPTW